MRVLLFESVTAGALSDVELSESLLREACSMVQALSADLSAARGVETSVVRRNSLASRLPLDGCRALDVEDAAEALPVLRREAARADWTVVIAPECDGALVETCRLVAESGGRLLGPSAELAELASDKYRTARHLATAGLPVPEGIALVPGSTLPAEFAYPAVLKPIDGAGSLGAEFVRNAEAAADLGPVSAPGRLERFHRGLPASVSLLAGPSHRIPLPACRQVLDDAFAYQGGATPLPPALASRADALARRAAEALPSWLGYIGIDLVLGDAADGGEDVVIEVNPRLTTSYVGLRTAASGNLAEAMLELAGGRDVSLSFESRALRFTAQGHVTFD